MPPDPTLPERRMIGAQPDLRQVGEQHLKIDIPRQQAQQLTRLRMAFASAEADIHLTADDGVQES